MAGKRKGSTSHSGHPAERRAAKETIKDIARNVVERKLHRTLVVDPAFAKNPSYIRPQEPTPQDMGLPAPGPAGLPGNGHSRYLTARIHQAFITDDDLAKQIWDTLRSIACDRDHPLVLRAIEIILDRTEGKLSTTISKDVRSEVRTTITVAEATSEEVGQLSRDFTISSNG